MSNACKMKLKRLIQALHFKRVIQAIHLACFPVCLQFFDVDYECISSLTTFNHLLYLCQHAAKTPTLGTDVTQSGTSR